VRRVIWISVAVGVIAVLPVGATAATCPDVDDVRGSNPSPATVAAAIETVAADRDVPAPLLAAVAFVEGYDPASARNWIQFESDGSPLLSADCGIGMMQVTDTDGFDVNRLASDWRYNLDAGAQLLSDKWDDSQAANPASLGDDDPSVLENWWAAIYRYNGSGQAASDYADRVFTEAVDPQAEAALHTPWLPGLRTPTQVFPTYTTSRQFQGRTTEALLTESDGTVVSRDTSFRPTAVPAADRPPAPRLAADATTAIDVGIQLSRAVFADDAARHVLLARDDDWADSLAGASLAGDWGPILYVPGGAAGTLPDAVSAELQRVLEAGGTVYLLGGSAAVSPAVEAGVQAAGATPRRLAGLDRLETAMAIAEETVRLDDSATEILVARAFDSPADALTGGAAAGDAHRPLVLTPTSAMPESILSRLEALGATTTVVLGGTAAVSDHVLDQLRGAGLAVERAAGADRYATAVQIAERLWGGVGRNVVAVDLATTSGWAWALASGPVAAAIDGPQLGVAPLSAPTATLDAIRGAGGTATAPSRVAIIGSAERASTDVRRTLRLAAEGT
jgi:putative cell wall-binding protein